MAASFPGSVKSFGADRVDGEYIPASDMNDVRAEIVAVETALLRVTKQRVTSGFAKTSDTTLANVTGLSVTVEAGRSYKFEAVLYTTSNVAGGVKAAMAGTATATAIVYEGLATNAGTTTQARGAAMAAAVAAVTAVTAALIVIRGTITVNAGGTLTVQFAQNASNGAASTVLVGSTLTVEDIG